jgi:hypothetical protein
MALNMRVVRKQAHGVRSSTYLEHCDRLRQIRNALLKGGVLLPNAAIFLVFRIPDYVLHIGGQCFRCRFAGQYPLVNLQLHHRTIESAVG